MTSGLRNIARLIHDHEWMCETPPHLDIDGSCEECEHILLQGVTR